MSKVYPSHFPPTSQTLIEALKSPDSKIREVSLARFCTLYYPAVYGYARQLGLCQEDAKDRTQDFFVKVVEGKLLSQFDACHRTRFRSWLMTCFRNMVIREHQASVAEKRGGGQQVVDYDVERAEHSYMAAHLAHLEPAPTFDLMLAREIWRASKISLLLKHQEKGQDALVRDLLPLVLMDRWPPRPMPTQEELAATHGTTPVRLKAFFNRTLKVQARRAFDREAEQDSPGIQADDLDHLWRLLYRYGEI